MHTNDLQNIIATRSELSHLNRTGVEERSFDSVITSGIHGLDPRNLHGTRAEVEAARIESERDQMQRDFDADNITDSEAPPPPPPKAKAVARSAFLPAPAAPHLEEDDTPHLTAKAATALAKDTRAVQRQLTQDLKEHLRSEEYAAAHKSSSTPTLLYGNNIEHVRVHKAHPWARVHRTHDLWRCDMTAYCRKCGSVSNTNSTKVMRDPCNPSISITPYHAGILTDLTAGRCPPAWASWQSGLAAHHNWPPVPLRVFIEDGKCHTACECIDCQPGNSCGPIAPPPNDSSDTDQDTAPTIPHHSGLNVPGTASQQAEDLADLHAMARSGDSTHHKPTPHIHSATVASSPEIEPSSLDDEPPGTYSGVWSDRTSELRTMWDLERSGTSVEWQDPGDRLAIQRVVAQELTSTIAESLRPTHLAEAQAQDNKLTMPRPIRNDDLISLLDHEGQGGTTILIEPRMREQAIAARLDQFWTSEFSHSSNEQPQLTCEWPELLPNLNSGQPSSQDGTAEAQDYWSTALATTQSPPREISTTTSALTDTICNPDGHNDATASDTVRPMG